MQCAVIEFARNVAGMEGAHSAEFSSDTKYPVIDLMEEQKKIVNMGGTMRLGAWPCSLEDGSNARVAYGDDDIFERHRHRYEYNSEYRAKLEGNGLLVAGISPESGLVEIVEIKDHPWFVACQFHPELKSRVAKAHPLFRDFVAAALKNTSH
jgi:CTP synthase